MKTLKWIFSLACIGLLLFSCKKTDVDTDIQSSIDHAICEQEFMKITPIVNSKAIAQVGISSGKRAGQYDFWSTQGCPLQEIIIDTGSSANIFPNRMIIVYDTITGQGCLGNDGKKRKGKVIVDFYYRWDAAATGDSLMIVTFDKYKVNNVSYSGEVIIGKPQNDKYRTQVINGKCWSSNFNLSWDCDRTVTWVEGASDSLATNDVYEISGTANGINRDGLAYDTQIKLPLVRKAECSNITAGVVEITPSGKGPRAINYGDETVCDSDAKVALLGNIFTIDLN